MKHCLLLLSLFLSAGAVAQSCDCNSAKESCSANEGCKTALACIENNDACDDACVVQCTSNLDDNGRALFDAIGDCCQGPKNDTCSDLGEDECTSSHECGLCKWDEGGVARFMCGRGGPDGLDPDFYPDQCCDSYAHADGPTDNFKKCGSGGSNGDCDAVCEPYLANCTGNDECGNALMCARQWDGECNSTCVSTCREKHIRTLEADMLFQWVGNCYGHCEGDDSIDDFPGPCEEEVCSDAVDACVGSTNCNKAWQCVMGKAALEDCDEGSCIEPCATSAGLNADEMGLFETMTGCIQKCREGGDPGNRDDDCDCSGVRADCQADDGCGAVLTCIQMEEKETGSCEGACVMECAKSLDDAGRALFDAIGDCYDGCDGGNDGPGGCMDVCSEPLAQCTSDDACLSAYSCIAAKGESCDFACVQACSSDLSGASQTAYSNLLKCFSDCSPNEPTAEPTNPPATDCRRLHSTDDCLARDDCGLCTWTVNGVNHSSCYPGSAEGISGPDSPDCCDFYEYQPGVGNYTQCDVDDSPPCFVHDENTCDKYDGCGLEQTCYATSKICDSASLDTPEKCRAQSDMCYWSYYMRSCEYAQVKSVCHQISSEDACMGTEGCDWSKHCSGGDDHDVGQDCYERNCVDLEDKCDSMPACMEAMECISEYDDCGEECMDECFDHLFFAHEFKTAQAFLQCKRRCEDEDTCDSYSTSAEKCKANDACQYDMECEPISSVCNSISDKSSCEDQADREACQWDEESEQCYYRTELHMCGASFATRDTCNSNPLCAWRKQCRAKDDDCDGVCADTQKACLSDAKCAAGMQCIGGAMDEGNCGMDCLTECRNLAGIGSASDKRLLTLANCFFGCQGSCTQNERPSILSAMVTCSDEDPMVILTVDASLFKDGTPLQGFCHFQSDICKEMPEKCSVRGWYDSGVLACPIPEALVGDNGTISAEVVPIGKDPSPFCSTPPLSKPISFDCPAPTCSFDRRPRIIGGEASCGLEGGVPLKVKYDVSIDNIEADIVVDCRFYKRTGDGTWSCDWHGCEAPGTMADLEGGEGVVTCAKPAGLTDNTPVLVSVSVRSSEMKESDACWSTVKPQYSPNIVQYDYFEYQQVCDGLPCLGDTRPEISMEESCGPDEGEEAVVTFPVTNIDTDYAEAVATCAFWEMAVASEEWSCDQVGCFIPAVVTEGGVTCKIPATADPTVRYRVTVRVFDKAYTKGLFDPNCASVSGDDWYDGSYAEFTPTCFVPGCTASTVPSIVQSFPDCEAADDVVTLYVTNINEAYEDDAVAKCYFFGRQKGGYVCDAFNACGVDATIRTSSLRRSESVAASRVECTIPAEVKAAAVEFQVGVKIYHSGDEEHASNQCFSYQGRAPSELSPIGAFATYYPTCPIPGCEDKPSIKVEDFCGPAESLEVYVDSVSDDYGEVGATCAIWTLTSAGWSCGDNCHEDASYNDETVTCSLAAAPTDSSEFRVTVSLFDARAPTEVATSMACSSHYSDSLLREPLYSFVNYRYECPVPGCEPWYKPMVFKPYEPCGASETLELAIGNLNPAYVSADTLNAKCVFWGKTSAGGWSCNEYDGCSSDAVISEDMTSVECTLPSNLEGTDGVYVSVRVWHKDNSKSSSNACFSTLGRAVSEDLPFGFATWYQPECSVPACSNDTIPMIEPIRPSCGLDGFEDEEEEEDGELHVAVHNIDRQYGDAAVATCSFYQQDSDGAWNCDDWCEQPARFGSESVTNFGAVSVYCEIPEGLDGTDKVRVTVRVAHESQSEDDPNCHSHTLDFQSDRKGMYGVWAPECPPPECSSKTVPKIFNINTKACNAIEEDEVSFLSFGVSHINGLYDDDDIRAECNYYSLLDNGEWVCGIYGCDVPAEVSDDLSTVHCSIPENWDFSDTTPLRVTVRVWQEGADENNEYCHSVMDSPKEDDVYGHYANYQISCGVPECNQRPVIETIRPACAGDVNSEVAVSVRVDPLYRDNARATCSFWLMTSDGSWSCQWHGCYAPARVSQDLRTVFCQVPDAASDDDTFRIGVQVYHSANFDNRMDNQCFSYGGQMNERTAPLGYGKWSVSCPESECLSTMRPRILHSPGCGSIDDKNYVTFGTDGVNPDYGTDVVAKCSFWTLSDGEYSCEAISGCDMSAILSADLSRVRCKLPSSLAADDAEELRVTLTAYQAGANVTDDCNSYVGEAPMAPHPSTTWAAYSPACFCPSGVKRFECPETTCGDCPAHPDAQCVIHPCGGCKPIYFLPDQQMDKEEALEQGYTPRPDIGDGDMYSISMYGPLETVDCKPRNLCLSKCKEAYTICSRDPVCRRSLAKIMSKIDDCDEDCFDEASPSKDSSAFRKYNALKTCFLNCANAQLGDDYQPTCQQPKEAGPCKAAFTRWYFDQASQECKQFTYGGCQGNANNFASKDECENSCDRGACCLRKMDSDKGYGYDRNGYDSTGFDQDGYARDGTTRRDSYSSSDHYLMAGNNHGYDSNGYDFRGYDRRQRDGYDFDRTGRDVYGVPDGLQYDYATDSQYNRDGYDRAGLDRSYIDMDGYGYNGLFEKATYTCEQATRSGCQAMALEDGVTVLSYAQGESCDKRVCGTKPDPKGCEYGGLSYEFGETFEFGCQECTCGTDGKVTCECDGGVATVRKEIRDMTTEEVQAFVDAVNQLHISNRWNQFAQRHLAAVPQAHGNPNFWPWHRLFLKELELLLRDISEDCTITIPYWDWTIDSMNPTASPVWMAVGSNGVPYTGCVVDGPFAAFSPCVTRNWNPSYTIPSFADVATVLSGADYTTVSAQVEALHGMIHMFVGGVMTSYGSPYDPIFFLHHAFIDKLWWDWQTVLGNGNAFPSSMLNIPMTPYATAPVDVLDSANQLCVMYQQPGSSPPPCDQVTFGSTSGGVYSREDSLPPKGYSDYVQVAYEVDPESSYFEQPATYPTRGPILGASDDVVLVKDCYTVPDRGVEYDLGYMEEVYRVQTNVYNSIVSGNFVPMDRVCVQLVAMPSWWRDINWINRGNDYSKDVTAYEEGLQTYQYSPPSQYTPPSTYSSYCFNADGYTSQPDRDVKPTDSYQPYASCICPKVYRPVCGSDGETYDNACHMACEGVKFAYAGECVSCSRRCSDEDQSPVCGKDGTTYSNRCMAKCAGAELAYKGRCIERPRTCEQVNTYKASMNVRKEICSSTTTTCLKESYSQFNRCIWDGKRCGCFPSKQVCSSTITACHGCCKTSLTNCLRDSRDALVCANKFADCKDSCANLFASEPKPEDGENIVKGELTLPLIDPGALDLDELVESIIAGLSIPGLKPSDIIIIDIVPPQSSRRRAAESVGVNFGIQTSGGNSTDEVEESLNQATYDGGLAEQLISTMPGAFDENATFSVAQSSDGQNAGDDDDSSSSSSPVAAIGGAVGGVVVVAIVIAYFVHHQKASGSRTARVSNRGSRTSVHSMTPKYEMASLEDVSGDADSQPVYDQAQAI